MPVAWLPRKASGMRGLVPGKASLDDMNHPRAERFKEISAYLPFCTLENVAIIQGKKAQSEKKCILCHDLDQIQGDI
jgi:hypothetical protein